jgi:hypothetical protein
MNFDDHLARLDQAKDRSSEDHRMLDSTLRLEITELVAAFSSAARILRSRSKTATLMFSGTTQRGIWNSVEPRYEGRCWYFYDHSIAVGEDGRLYLPEYVTISNIPSPWNDSTKPLSGFSRRVRSLLRQHGIGVSSEDSAAGFQAYGPPLNLTAANVRYRYIEYQPGRPFGGFLEQVWPLQLTKVPVDKLGHIFSDGRTVLRREGYRVEKSLSEVIASWAHSLTV